MRDAADCGEGGGARTRSVVLLLSNQHDPVIIDPHKIVLTVIVTVPVCHHKIVGGEDMKGRAKRR